MTRIFFILIVAVTLAAGCNKSASVNPESAPGTTAATGAQQQSAEQNNPPVKTKLSVPMDRAGERITKKSFGTYVEPGNSPVSPEKFTGYHTALDFEIFPGEEDAEVVVRTICAGKLLSKRTATGYGGVTVQSCTLNDQPVTIVYGHVRLSSVTAAVGDVLEKGQQLGVLGKGFSAETSGERKHLHMGVHKGTAIDIRGYVPSQAQLSAWLDPSPFIE
jgi:hypothetical protein